MRNKFDRQLENLHFELTEMGNLCERAIEEALSAFCVRDKIGLKKAIETDKQIDEKEREIEQLCMRLLMLEAPVAGDLRMISSALKMISDMERIGDQAADIADIAEYIIESSTHHEEDIREMGKKTVKMVRDSIKSFVYTDVELARAVIEYDDTVDDWFDRIKNSLICYIRDDGENGEYYIDLLMIAKYLERIGDHAENIAEWVEYSITGIHRKY